MKIRVYSETRYAKLNTHEIEEFLILYLRKLFAVPIKNVGFYAANKTFPWAKKIFCGSFWFWTTQEFCYENQIFFWKDKIIKKLFCCRKEMILLNLQYDKKYLLLKILQKYKQFFCYLLLSIEQKFVVIPTKFCLFQPKFCCQKPKFGWDNKKFMLAG